MKFLYKLVKVAFVFMIVMTIFFVGLYLYAVSLPKININNVNNISIYDKENDIIFSGNGNKEWISLNNISNYLIDATISTEDKRFYNHPGFDILRIAKSMYVNVTTKNLSQGASTITQQLARNLFSNFDKTWRRKLKEAWYAFRIEIDYSKDEILEAYLNTINYGNGVLGIENASYYYFNKSAKDLSLAEASMLAGIPKAPNAYSPLNDSETAKKRQGIILNYMVKNKKISEKEAEDAYDIELKYIGKKQKLNLSTLMYYKDAVVNELNSIKSIPDSYINSGLKVYTSLDINAQTILENSMKNNINDDKLQVASIMMKPDNGAIIALIGGTDYLKTEYNRALYSKRQVGSTMKPILYYAALENGFTASTNFLSQATTFTFSDNDTYTPQNYGAIYPNHDISMAAAIAYSDNIYAVKTHLFLGEEVLVNTAKRIGINETLEKIPSLPLGTEELNIIDYVGGYATFANGGYKIKPHLIEKVLDCNDNVLYEFKEEKEPVLNSSIVYILNDLMTGTYDLTMIDYNYPTCGSLVNKITNKYAIKTGTTDTDSWTIGYNKDILIGVWNGYDDAKTIEINAVKSSKNIWADAIEGYLKDKDTSWYDMPDNVVGVLVDPINGTLADNKTKKKKILYYIKGTEPIN
ncbi:MAG: transglycosylase domain-containing protein [bacterium]|nr:transglycosylase domain-containing protein [bacterium]MDY4108852.1 transglycosylase domain-containing protein [Bacilli bacterium]